LALPDVRGDVDRTAARDRVGAVRVDDAGGAVGDVAGRPSRPSGVRGGCRSGEYPDPQHYDPITADEVNGAIDAAQACLSAAEKLIVVLPTRHLLREAPTARGGRSKRITRGEV
jgi:hypothetical protein